MFVVHFMRSSHGFRITIISISEQFKSLVDKDVVNGKISQTISENAQANCQTNFEYIILPKQKETNTYYGVKNEKGIIAFKPRIMVFFVVISVKIPQETVHNVFVAKPSHKFHNAKRDDKNDYM